MCIEEMGPLSIRPYPGWELVRAREGGLAGRAKWELELDRDRKPGGYVFGAFIPAAGEALSATYTSRSIVTFVDFLEKVEEWVPEGIGRVSTRSWTTSEPTRRPTTSWCSTRRIHGGNSSSSPSTRSGTIPGILYAKEVAKCSK